MDEKENYKLSDDEKLAFSHSWNWFVLHANQRMQCVNFFLVAVALLSAGYSASINDNRYWIAFALALMGAWFSFCFNQLEQRSKELVKAGEVALKQLEKRVRESIELVEVEILESVETPAKRFTSYSQIINSLQRTAIVLFVVGGLYALICAITQIPEDI